MRRAVSIILALTGLFTILREFGISFRHLVSRFHRAMLLLPASLALIALFMPG
jgi:hypothetical protein